MRDATEITKLTFYIGQTKTRALYTYMTEAHEIYVALQHPNGGQMNVHAKNLPKYLKPQPAPKEETITLELV